MEEIKIDLARVNLKLTRPQLVRVMVFQLETSITDWRQEGALYYPLNTEKFKNKIKLVLRKAKEKKVNLLVFPELSIPKECLKLIKEWTVDKNVIVVAGSHYHKIGNKIISRCPVIHNKKIYYTEKIEPAPDEFGNSPKNVGLSSGSQIAIFQNTPIGNFAILICSDYLNQHAKDHIKEEKLDFWIVPAFQRKSEWYYNRMTTDVENTRSSRYIVYANNLVNNYADGNSAFYGMTYQTAIKEFANSGYSKNGYKWNLVSLNESNNYYIIDVDIEYKRPGFNKLPSDKPNIVVVEVEYLAIGELREKSEVMSSEKPDLFETIRDHNIEAVDIDILRDFHKFTEKNYLKKNIYLSTENFDDLVLKYSAVFSPLLTIKKGADFINSSNIDCLFISVVEIIEKSQSQNPLLVNGYAGCGKTAFLSILYWIMYQRHRNGYSTKLPILINLHYYNRFIYPTNGIKFIDQAIRKLRIDINPIINFIRRNPNKEVVIIVDGADEYVNPKVDLDDIIANEIANISVKTKVIGLRKQKDDHTKSNSKSKTFQLIEDPEVEIELSKIGVDSTDFFRFISAFGEIEAFTTGKTSSAIKEYLHKKVKLFKIEELDLFMAILLMRGFKAEYKYEKAKSLSRFFKIYIEEFNLDISKSAELAFKIFNQPDKVTEKEKNQEEWWMIQKNESLRDYLVAYNIVNKLIEYNPKDKGIFNFVYPYDLNNFCKEIINEEIAIQNKAFNSIQQLITKVDLTARTHLCYLLGRFDDKTVKEKAMIFLKNTKPEADKLIKQHIPFDSNKLLTFEEKKLLLYLRTIYISLTYLGDKDSSSEYVKQLMHNKYFDNLNRGFHLEYYEDIIFEPASPESLKHEDNLGEFDKTYQRLYKKIELGLNTRNYYSMFQIELYTLCSLAQHRQANGNLEDNKRILIVDLIKRTLLKNHDLDHDFYVYLKFILVRFDNPGKFKIASFTKELFSLKSLPRTGWVKRNISNPETVASHMYGAFMLGFLHLPSHIDGKKGYDKNEVLRMILIHDLGEAYVGDLTPDEQTTDTKKREERQFEFLSLIGNYNGLSSIPNIATLFRSFTHDQNDINCVIAREIDKLDNLLQLYIYHTDPTKGPVEDFEDFKVDLIREISTETGHSIMKNIEDLFE